MLAGSASVETFIFKYGQRSQVLCYSFVESLIKKTPHAKIFCVTKACGTQANPEVGGDFSSL